MTAFKSDFLKVLRERGFIHQISDPESLDALAAKGELVAYCLLYTSPSPRDS